LSDGQLNGIGLSNTGNHAKLVVDFPAENTYNSKLRMVTQTYPKHTTALEGFPIAVSMLVGLDQVLR
jgi:hypothetical protein